MQHARNEMNEGANGSRPYRDGAAFVPANNQAENALELTT